MNKLLDFDSALLRVPVGRSLGYDEIETPAWCRRENLALHYLLVDARNARQVQQAERDGWRYMDTRVTLARQTKRLPGDDTIREAQPSDREPLREIARRAFTHTRFYADPNIPTATCDALYDNWLCEALDDPARTVLVASGAPTTGFVALSRRGEETSLDLIAVSRAARGQGIGRRLVHAAIDWAYDTPEIVVVTQGSNIGAQRLFQSCWFRSVHSQLWLHRWFR